MSLRNDELYFAPSIPMSSLDFSNPDEIIKAYQERLTGFFIQPIKFQIKNENTDGGLFSAALLCAALVESISRIEFYKTIDENFISHWLEDKFQDFKEKVGTTNKTIAQYYEERYRHGLAHNGYITSLGQLSSEIKYLAQTDGKIVTINPFKLIHAIEEEVHKSLKEIEHEKGKKEKLVFLLKDYFKDEVESAKQRKKAG